MEAYHAAVKSTTMEKCKVCGEDVDPSKIIRVYGKDSIVVVTGVCSTLCYTNMNKDEKSTVDTRTAIYNKVDEIFEKAKRLEISFNGVYHGLTPLLQLNFKSLNDEELVDVYTKLVYHYSKCF